MEIYRLGQYVEFLLKVSTNFTAICVRKWDSLTKNGMNKPLAKLNLARGLLSWLLCLSLAFAHKYHAKVHANF